MKYRLRVLPGLYSVARLPAGVPVPDAMMEGPFWQVLQSPDERTVICEEARVPKGMDQEPGWRVLALEGPFTFDAVGVLHALLTPLKKSGVPLLALSGYSTDYILVQDLRSATTALQREGHRIY